MAIGNTVFTTATAIQLIVVATVTVLGWTVSEVYIHTTGPEEHENIDLINSKRKQIINLIAAPFEPKLLKSKLAKQILKSINEIASMNVP